MLVTTAGPAYQPHLPCRPRRASRAREREREQEQDRGDMRCVCDQPWVASPCSCVRFQPGGGSEPSLPGDGQDRSGPEVGGGLGLTAGPESPPAPTVKPGPEPGPGAPAEEGGLGRACSKVSVGVITARPA